MQLEDLPDLVLETILHHLAISNPTTLLHVPQLSRNFRSFFSDLSNGFWFRAFMSAYCLGIVEKGKCSRCGDLNNRKADQLQLYEGTITAIQKPMFLWSPPSTGEGRRPEFSLWCEGIAFSKDQFQYLSDIQRTMTPETRVPAINFKDLFTSFYILKRMGTIFGSMTNAVSESDEVFVPILLQKPSNDTTMAFFDSVNLWKYLIQISALGKAPFNLNEFEAYFDESVGNSNHISKIQDYWRKTIPELYRFYIPEGFAIPCTWFIVGEIYPTQSAQFLGGVVTGVVWT